jgi:hypothetical protein
MGLFRCSGWGPSCTGGGASSGFGSNGFSSGFNSPVDKIQQQQQSRRRKHQRSYDQQQKHQQALTTVSAAGIDRTTVNNGNRSGGIRRQTAKFEPFFALTSGKCHTQSTKLSNRMISLRNSNDLSTNRTQHSLNYN